jgi:hypothetical protein
MKLPRLDAITRVNLHYLTMVFAQGTGFLFLFVFLLRAGVSAPLVLLAQAAIVTGRLCARPFLLPLAKRMGLRPLLMLGSAVMGLQYLLLPLVHGPGWALAALCAAAAAGDVFYWLPFNAYYAAVGDAARRGRQIAMREALAAGVGIVAPLTVALSLVAVGPWWTFWTVAAVQASAALPLIGAPDVKVPAEAPGAFKAARAAFPLMAADGWFDACWLIMWQIALFASLHESFSAYGGALALAGMVGAGGGLALGHRIDAGHGRRAVAVTYAVATIIVLLRGASLGWPALAVAAHALGALLMPLLGPTLGFQIANMSKASPCTFRFSMVTEGGWDVGCCGACLAGAALLSLGAPLSGLILLALPAAAASAAILRRLYPPSAQTLARPTLL